MEHFLEELKKKRRVQKSDTINHGRRDIAKMVELEIEKFPWDLLKKHLEHSPDALRKYEEICELIRHEIRESPYVAQPSKRLELYEKFYYEQLPPTFMEATLKKCINTKKMLLQVIGSPYVIGSFALGIAVGVAAVGFFAGYGKKNYQQEGGHVAAVSVTQQEEGGSMGSHQT